MKKDSETYFTVVYVGPWNLSQIQYIGKIEKREKQRTEVKEHRDFPNFRSCLKDFDTDTHDGAKEGNDGYWNYSKQLQLLIQQLREIKVYLAGFFQLEGEFTFCSSNQAFKYLLWWEVSQMVAMNVHREAEVPGVIRQKAQTQEQDIGQ